MGAKAFAAARMHSPWRPEGPGVLMEADSRDFLTADSWMVGASEKPARRISAKDRSTSSQWLWVELTISLQVLLLIHCGWRRGKDLGPNLFCPWL